jgi:hypothetical protein
MAARMAMMAMTTNSSINVKASKVETCPDFLSYRKDISFRKGIFCVWQYPDTRPDARKNQVDF